MALELKALRPNTWLKELDVVWGVIDDGPIQLLQKPSEQPVHTIGLGVFDGVGVRVDFGVGVRLGVAVLHGGFGVGVFVGVLVGFGVGV